MVSQRLFLGGGPTGISPNQTVFVSSNTWLPRVILRKGLGSYASTEPKSSNSPFRVVFNTNVTNPRKVSDSSDYTRFKKLQAIKRTYNNTKL